MQQIWDHVASFEVVLALWGRTIQPSLHYQAIEMFWLKLHPFLWIRVGPLGSLHRKSSQRDRDYTTMHKCLLPCVTWCKVSFKSRILWHIPNVCIIAYTSGIARLFPLLCNSVIKIWESWHCGHIVTHAVTWVSPIMEIREISLYLN